MKNPKVSVLIPVYNSEIYIADAIRSALDQTYTNIELIIVDDGSTDNSLQIAKEFESEKVKVFSQSNLGAPRARNVAFEKSTGDYIQYLDADDLLAPNKIETQINILSQNDNNYIAFCSHTRDINNFLRGRYLNQEINKDYSNPIDLYLDLFNDKGNVLVMSWLSPRALIHKAGVWDERLIKAQDPEFFIRVALNSKAVIFCSQTNVYYRPAGTTSIAANRNPKAIESVILSNELIQETILKYENSRRVEKALIFSYSRIFCTYYNLNNAKLLKRVERNINSLNGKLQFSGNKYFKILSFIIGVKNSLLVKNIVKNMQWRIVGILHLKIKNTK